MSDSVSFFVSCAICESSTRRKVEIDGKTYGVCDSCYNVINAVLKELLKSKK